MSAAAPPVPVRDVRFGPNAVTLERANGAIYVRSIYPLGPYPVRLTDRLDYWAERAPERVFLGQRDEQGEWRTLTYAEAREKSRNVAEALLGRNLSPERPVAILSPNDLEQALLALGAMYAGIPFGPISPSYSLISSDFGKLRHIFGLLTPGLVYVADPAPYRRALEAVVPPDVELVTRESFAAFVSTRATDAVDRATAAVGPDTIAKFLFTSGSTGTPKGVINPQRMLTSNQEIVRTVLPFVDDEPPVLCDWMPWHHTFGGNHDFGWVLYNGGSLYIDEGKPVPGAIEKTIRNLHDVAPNVFLNVPKGFEALLPFLRDRPDFRQRFFSRLKLFYYAGAGLSQAVWDELQRYAVEACGEKIIIFTGLGSTETGPAGLFSGKDLERAGDVGLPAPGVELKLVPREGKLELRMRGPSITPGYWRQPELTQAAFDEEGFYKLGDALRFVDPDDVSRGFAFDGRIAEDFKLSTGTWVSTGPLRMKFLTHCAPYAQDVVMAGHDGDYVAALIFPASDACRGLAPEELRSIFEAKLRELAGSSSGSSNRIARAVLLEEPPSIDAHEITDKGSINQGAVLRHRAALVKDLYAEKPSAKVIVI
jgi:feruloyl-CoA synthase